MRAVEGAAVEHERGLGRGGLLEVDGSGMFLRLELDLGYLSAETGGRVSAHVSERSERRVQA